MTNMFAGCMRLLGGSVVQRAVGGVCCVWGCQWLYGAVGSVCCMQSLSLPEPAPMQICCSNNTLHDKFSFSLCLRPGGEAQK